jgi:hypothetical protein
MNPTNLQLERCRYYTEVTVERWSEATYRSRKSRRIGNKNSLPYGHVLLVFLSSLSAIPDASRLTNHAARVLTPWGELFVFLNTLPKSERLGEHTIGFFSFRVMSDNVPLPQDYLLHG